MNNELYHYGVKGMKWGVHKKRSETSVDRARSAYKTAKKDYNKSYNSAYDYSRRYPISQFTSKKRRVESDRRWEDAQNKAKTLDSAKKAYKAEKEAVRALKKMENQKHKDFVKTRSKEILKGESVVAKMWDIYTGAHKIQAELEYNLRKYDD